MEVHYEDYRVCIKYKGKLKEKGFIASGYFENKIQEVFVF
jgi:hypothetical protein